MKKPYHQSYYFILSIFCLIVFPISTIYAQLSVTAQVSNSKIYLGDELVFKLKVNGTQDNVRLHFPKAKNLKYRIIGSPSRSTQTSIINGRMSSFHGIEYRIGVTPQTKGNHVVSPIQVEWNGQIYQNRSFNLTVLTTTQQNTATIKIIPSKKKVYLEEPLQLEIKVSFSAKEDTSNSKIRFPLLHKKKELNIKLSSKKQNLPVYKFIVENYEVPFYQSSEMIKGERFLVFSTKLQITPNQIGKLEIPLASLRTRIRQGYRYQRDFFGYNQVPRYASKFSSFPSFFIQVLPLPKVGQPKSFTGAIGSFKIQAKVQDKNFKVGDPIQIQIVVQGKGKLSKVKRPRLDQIPEFQKNFVVTESLELGKFEKNKIIFTQTIRAKSDQAKQIPKIPFSFFDPTTGTYKTEYSDAIAVTIEPAILLKEKDIVTYKAQQTTEKQTSIFLQKKLEGFHSNYLYQDILTSQSFQLWHFLFLLFPTGYLILWGIQNSKMSIYVKKSDFSSVSSTLKELKKIQYLLKTGKEEDNQLFYKTIQVVVRNFFHEHCDFGKGEFTELEVQELVDNQKITQEQSEKITQFLQNCNRYRFTNSKQTVEQKNKLYQQAKQIIQNI
ncbi:MAG: hypothetical protein ACI86H_001453 [bacterium]|jgi:hypothetical protein